MDLTVALRVQSESAKEDEPAPVLSRRKASPRHRCEEFTMSAAEYRVARKRSGTLRSRAWKSIFIISALLCGVCWNEAVSANAEYEFTLIEAFDVDYTLREVILRDINESGFVTGTATHNSFYDGFTWTAQTDKVIFSDTELNFFSKSRSIKAMDVITNPATGACCHS
jgi:hypothetical protein